MKVLVVGGAGFIGYHMAKTLLERGHHVVVWDSLETGTFYDMSKDVLCVKCDITKDRLEIPKDVDVVMNFATSADTPFMLKRSPRVFEQALIGHLRLAQALPPSALYVYVSTSEVYGLRVDLLTEDTPGLIPVRTRRTAYGIAKMAAEEHIFLNMNERSVVVRLFNVYGPRRLRPSLVKNFVLAALKNEPLIVYGDGQQTRTLTYVSDAVEGILTALSRPGDVYNIAGDTEMKVIDLAHLVIELTGSKSEIKFADPLEADCRRRRPVTDKIRSLGWEPKVSVRDGIMETVRYWRKYLQGVAI